MHRLARKIMLRFFLITLCHITFWKIACSLVPAAPKSLRNKSIVLLIAHPDDESMFFSPAVQALSLPSFSNDFRILCLSTGNAAGLGAIRREELKVAALKLGVRTPHDVIVVDDETRFKDDMDHQWDEGKVADLMASIFTNQTNLSSLAPWDTPEVLITFDSSGVSFHPNHVSLYHGARRFLRNFAYDSPVRSIELYTLNTVSLLRHYGFVYDIIPTSLSSLVSFWRTIRASRLLAKDQDRVLFLSNPAQYWSARKAMVEGHRSQSVWFRWPWIVMGRYMVVNHLQREQVSTDSQ